MDWDSLDTEELQAVSGKERHDRGDTQVEQVLVVDRVELSVVDEVLHVGELEYRNAVGLQQGADPGHEVVRVRPVGQDVVGVQHVSTLAGAGEALSQLAAVSLSRAARSR